jgi:phytoene dehydrogenase-like protein
MSVDYDYIVIGGGIAGCHIGALLSQHGKVLVLEKTKEIGGRAKVTEKDGFKLDWGPHPIRYGPDSSLGKSLSEIGKPIEFIKPGLVRGYLADGSVHIYPAGSVGAVFKSKMVPKMKFLGLMIRIKKKITEQDRIDLFDTSLEEWFKQEDTHPKIQKFLTMASAAIQVNPFIDNSSVGEMLDTFYWVLQYGSGWYPKGGWGVIFSRFLDKIKKNGEILTSSQVSEIIIENGKAVGVKVGEKVIKGGTIISTIPVQQLFTILDEKLCDEKLINYCKSAIPTSGVSITYCLSKPVVDIAGNSELGNLMFEDPLAFAVIPTNFDPDLAPSGKSILMAHTIDKYDVIKDKNRANELLEKLKLTLLKFFPIIDGNIEFERPLIHEIIDGVNVGIDSHRLKRPGNTIEGISNLYITGDSIGGEGAGGDVGHTSVRNCYEQIINS